MASEFNISLANAHRADEDAYATAMLLKHCWQQLLRLPQVTLEQLHKRSFRLKSNLSPLFFEALQRKRQQRAQTERYFYVRNIALKSGEIGEAVSDETVLYPQSSEEKLQLLTKAMPQAEMRLQQFSMMDAVWQALEHKKEVVIEASTGIGKTLGYLLPAIIYARQSKKKIVVSTYTAHLLDQLLQREVPKLEQVIGSRVRVALLKGMQHYIDLARFEQLMQNDDESYDETLAILQVLVWLSQTSTGDVNELNLSGGGQFLVDKIRKYPDYSFTSKKVFDFYEKAIKHTLKADIIVTNHAMLLADLMRNEPLFEKIDGWIIDEAHQFVQAAANRDEIVLSYGQWKYVLGKIGLIDDHQLFAKFYQAALKTACPDATFATTTIIIYKNKGTSGWCYFQFSEATATEGKGSSKDVKLHLLLSQLTIHHADSQLVTKTIWQWIDLASEVATLFSNELEQLTAEERFILSEWQYWMRELKIKAIEWEEIFSEHKDAATWLEMDRRNVPGSMQLRQKPVDSTATVQQFFNPLRGRCGIIWTSGTLTVPNHETFLTKQLSIADDVPIIKLQAEPSYYQGATAYIVTDMPDIQQVSQNDYIEAVAHAITEYSSYNGRSLFRIVFSRYVRKTVALIQDSELLHDYMLFAQGVTSGRSYENLKSFQKFQHSVLFGTNSFGKVSTCRETRYRQ